MNRRSFLQLMFSLAAGKAVERVLPQRKPVYNSETILSAFNAPTYVDTTVPTCCPWTWVKNFELSALSPAKSLSIAVDRDAPFALHQIGLYLSQDCPHESAKQFFDEVVLEMCAGNHSFSAPAWAMGSATTHEYRFGYPMLLSDDGLNVSLEAAQKWVPPAGIKGQIIMQGVKVYSPLRDMPSKR